MMRRAAIAVLLSLPAGASAHSGYGREGGFLPGLSHAFAGPDHAVAMVALGLWAGMLGGRAALALPGAFLAGMAAGWLPGAIEPARGLVEVGVFISALLVPLVVSVGWKPSLPVAVVVGAVIGVLHGHAHGAEIAAGQGFFLYGLGFLVAASALLAVGFGVARAAIGMGQFWLVRIAGVAALALLLRFALF